MTRTGCEKEAALWPGKQFKGRPWGREVWIWALPGLASALPGSKGHKARLRFAVRPGSRTSPFTARWQAGFQYAPESIACCASSTRTSAVLKPLNPLLFKERYGHEKGRCRRRECRFHDREKGRDLRRHERDGFQARYGIKLVRPARACCRGHRGAGYRYEDQT